MLICEECSIEYESGKFCSNCGAGLKPKPKSSSGVCPNCKFMNAENVKFCSECGTELQPAANQLEQENPNACPKCGTDNPENWKFCHGCSHKREADFGEARSKVQDNIKKDTDEGVADDPEKAFFRIKKAADQGHAAAQYALGECYFLRQGVDEDNIEAVKWFRKAADQGNTAAQCAMGCLYISGMGVDIDCKEAIKWFRKAADQGNTAAQYQLGHCLLLGWGVDKDKEIAMRWYRKAAEQGNVAAQRAMGNCAKDMAERRKWFNMITESCEIITQKNYSWGIKWSDFMRDDIWIKNCSDEDWNQSDFFLEVTIKRLATKDVRFYSLLEVPALSAYETYLFKDMILVSGKDKQNQGEAQLYRLKNSNNRDPYLADVLNSRVFGYALFVLLKNEY